MNFDELKVTLKMLNMMYKNIQNSNGIYIRLDNDVDFDHKFLRETLDKYNFDWNYVYNNTECYGIYLIRGEKL